MGMSKVSFTPLFPEMGILKTVFLVDWISAPMQEPLQAQQGSCPSVTLYLVILGNLTTMEWEGLPVDLC